jgi:hypothetical protein
VHKVVFSAALAGLVVFGAAELSAQACVGTASFAGGPVRLGGGVSFMDGATQYGAQLGLGRHDGAFGGVEVARADIDDTEVGGMSYLGSVGYQVPVGTARRAQVCPVGSFRFQRIAIEDDEFLGSFEARARTFTAGLAVGAPFPAGATAEFIPYGSISMANQRATLELDGFEESASETFGIIDLGAGFVLNQRITFRPSISFPVGLENSDATMTLGVGFNFGGARE